MQAGKLDRRIVFTRNFDWSPPEHKGRLTIAYKAGQKVFARNQCAADAIAAGAAKPQTKEK